MKNHLIYKMCFALIMLLGITSCADREELAIQPTGSAILMNLSTDNLILDQNYPANGALTVKWQPSTYSVPMEVKYTVEISSTPAFKTPYVLTTKVESQTIAAFSNKEMNSASKAIGLVPYEVQKMYFRVTSYIGSTASLAQVSPITSLNIKPYASSPTYTYKDLFLIGAATAGGWDNNIANSNLLPLLKTADPTKYTFTGFFKADGFKMIKVKGSWDAQFGLGGAAGQLSTDGGSGNITAPADGYYKLTVDTAALTYTLVPVTVPATTYAGMSIIGTVNGNFDNDTQLTKSSFDPHLWKILGASLKGGEFKFRANNNWDVNWGTNAEYFGTATNGGANIPLSSEWTYDVYFNDATGDYTVIPVL